MNGDFDMGDTEEIDNGRAEKTADSPEKNAGNKRKREDVLSDGGAGQQSGSEPATEKKIKTSECIPEMENGSANGPQPMSITGTPRKPETLDGPTLPTFGTNSFGLISAAASAASSPRILHTGVFAAAAANSAKTDSNAKAFSSPFHAATTLESITTGKAAFTRLPNFAQFGRSGSGTHSPTPSASVVDGTEQPLDAQDDGVSFTSLAKTTASGGGGQTFASLLSSATGSPNWSSASTSSILFGGAAKKKAEDDGGDEEEHVEQEEVVGGFAPAVNLEPRQVVTGEEDEETLYQERCKLYSMEDSGWKERGIGNIRLNVKRADKHAEYRLVMRLAGVLRLLLNVRVLPKAPCDLLQEKSVQFLAAEKPGTLTRLLVRFKSKERASEFAAAMKKASSALTDSEP